MHRLRTLLPLIAVLAVFVGLTLAMFHPYIFGGKVVMTTDATIVTKVHSSKPILDVFLANWRDQGFVGNAHYIPVRTMEFLLKALGAIAFNNLVWPIVALLSSLALLYYFRLRSVSWRAGMIACLCAFWVGSNFTLLAAGHALKFFVLLFFVLTIACTERAVRSTRWYDSVLMGTCAGAMFVHQPDVALFFSLFWLAYLAFRLWREQPKSMGPWIKILGFSAVPALLLAAGPLLMGYSHRVKNVSIVQDQNAEQKWEYVTQWSWPPDECINFVAPGYSGWRSGEPEGPYWGRVGRSAGWDRDRSGFQNLMMESAYLGAIPIALAVLAVFLSRRSKHRAEILFWAIAAGIALFLSFGKYTPLYALFYKLPVVSNIRNPNKFLQVFQVAVAILSGYGAHALMTRAGDAQEQKRLRAFFWIVAGCTALAALGAFSFASVSSRSIAQFQQQGWTPGLAEVITATRTRSMWHLAGIGILLTGLFGCIAYPSVLRGRFMPARHGPWIVLSLGLAVAGDAYALSRHYITSMPRSYIERNAVTDAVKSVIDQGRVAFATQQGVYNIWVTYLFPYQGIRLFNTSSTPRLPKDYETFFNALGNAPLRMWQVCGVNLIIVPRSMAEQLPEAQFPRVGGFNVGVNQAQELVVSGAATNAAHMLIQNRQAVPQFALMRQSRIASDEEALRILATDVTHDPRTTVLLEEAGEETIPEREYSGGEIQTVYNRAGRIQLRVVTDSPGVLRIANKYDPFWTAHIDDKPIPIVRADYLFQALAVPAGVHVVTLRYAPSTVYFWLQVTGILMCVGALGVAGRAAWVNGNAAESPDSDESG